MESPFLGTVYVHSLSQFCHRKHERFGKTLALKQRDSLCVAPALCGYSAMKITAGNLGTTGGMLPAADDEDQRALSPDSHLVVLIKHSQTGTII